MARVTGVPGLLLAAAVALSGPALAGQVRSELAPVITLFSAVKQGNTDVVKEELALGTSPNSVDDDGTTPLVYAVVAGHQDVVEVLLESGAQVDSRDGIGNTALIWAAEQGHTEIAETLIDAGAKMDAQNRQGQTALIKAVQQGRRQVVRLLIKRRSALIWAERSRDRRIAEILRDAGAR
jgi:ankyrin repeat protein